MLHESPLIQTISSPGSEDNIALHPFKAKLALNKGKTVIARDYRNGGAVTAVYRLPCKVVKSEYSPCGQFLFILTSEVTVDQNQKQLSCYRLSLAAAESPNKVFAEALIQSSDPLKLEPCKCFLQFEYSYRNTEQLKFVWLCVNQ